jgi:hypothetical protein
LVELVKWFKMRKILLLALLSSCTLQNTAIAPTITYFPQERTITCLPDTFPPLNYVESETSWGQEILIGIHFGKEVDLYRSITAFKRAKILIPKTHPRLKQIDYSLIVAYYLGNKYYEAIEIFENGACSEVQKDFPGLDTLLIILYDCYTKTSQIEKATCILEIINAFSPELTSRLQTGTAIQIGSFEALECLPRDECLQEAVDEFLTSYDSLKKSPRKAQLLNAVLPGAGYFYLEQPKTALTAIIVNGLFIAATYQLFKRGYIAPAIFTLSLESGWYLGGINGGGLGAKEYNEALYNTLGKETMLKERLFPVLEIKHAF